MRRAADAGDRDAALQLAQLLREQGNLDEALAVLRRAAADDWFGGEAEVAPATVRMDVRKGGRWRLTMFAGPDRREIAWKGEYLEVLEPERLVFTVSDRPDEVYELVTVVLTDLGDGRTEMRFSQRGHLSPAQYRRAGSGWASFFDRIAARLAAS